MDYVRPELDVDLSCPGLGRGGPILTEWSLSPAEDEKRLYQREQAIQQIQGLLRAQNRYAAPDLLAKLGENCLDELQAGWPVTTLQVEQTRPVLTNAETPDHLAGLWQGLVLHRRPVETLLSDTAFVEKHFGRPQWNTRLSSRGMVTVYCFWTAGAAFCIEERGGRQKKIPLEHVQQVPWQAESLVVRRLYLQRWLRRQLPLRLANNLAVANLLQGSHVAQCYLEFLLEVDWRLAVLAPMLAQTTGKEVVDRAVALEAMRGSDGLLRAWCQSARLKEIRL
jgi:hypothetical protein